jgi:hypothetical protein
LKNAEGGEEVETIIEIRRAMLDLKVNMYDPVKELKRKF